MISSGFITLNWLAASSIANGRPSSWRQISNACSTDTSGASAVRRARSVKSRAESASASGWIGRTNSPSTPSGLRLVESTRALRAAPSTATVVAATDSTMCSQLSSTTKHAARCEQSGDDRRQLIGRMPVCRLPLLSRSPAVRGRVRAPRRGRPSTRRTREAIAQACADLCARRVLPMPPGPVSVTNLLSPTARGDRIEVVGPPDERASGLSACCRPSAAVDRLRFPVERRVVAQDRILQLGAPRRPDRPPPRRRGYRRCVEHTQCLDLAPTRDTTRASTAMSAARATGGRRPVR